jgi:hypothetical protein
MKRIVGIETEYGCLVSGEQAAGNVDAWPARVKNHVFKRMKAGAIDLHYRDYEEPPAMAAFSAMAAGFTSTWGTSSTPHRSAARCAMPWPTNARAISSCRRR